MALQVWLPLNGNLDNQGLSNITVTNSEATVDNNGKIGKCYNFNGTSSETTINGIDLSGCAIFSICVWLCPTNTNNVTASVAFSKNTYWQFVFNNRQIEIRDTSTGITGTRKSYTMGDFPAGVWTHVAITYNKGEVKIYRNGVLYSTNNTGGTSLNVDTFAYKLGRANGESYRYNGKINDFRIYDHCLSPKEVKEISKGLILHYPLNFYPKNLIPFLLTTENYTSTNYRDYTSSTISNGVYHVDGYQNETPIDTWFQIKSNNYISLPSNKTVYLSFYCKNKNTASTFFGTSGYSGITRLIDDSNNNYFPQSQVNIGTEYEGRVVLTFTTGSSINYKLQIGMDTPNLYGIGSYIEISKIMISEDNVNYYIPYYDNANTIYDCSGYNNNGSIREILSPDLNTPRYKYCTQFGSGKYISPSLWPSFLTNECTISMWIKLDQLPPSSPGRTMLYTAWYGFSCEITSAGKTYFRTYLTSGQVDSPSGNIETGNWIHWVGVKSSTGVSLYLNGILIGTTSNTNNFNWSSSINNKIASFSTSYFLYGKMSDLRLYSTALSEKSIKELYNIGGYIDNSGNVFQYESEERCENLFKPEYWNETINLSRSDNKYVTYTDRNGSKAIALPANWFYYSSSEVAKYHYVGKFKENTQYKFDFWIDYDDIIYDNSNKAGGIVVYYTDGTSTEALCGIGNSEAPLGWQHKFFISSPGKSIRRLSIYYYIATPAFYRWDSTIVEIDNNATKMKKSGINSTGQFRECSEIAKINKGNHFDTNQIIEI